MIAAASVAVYVSGGRDNATTAHPTTSAIDLFVTGIAQGTRTPSPSLRTALAIEATGTPGPLTSWQAAEQDSGNDVPGLFYPSLGRGHFSSGLRGHVMTPFCDDLAHASASVPTAIATPSSPGPGVSPLKCHNSNPPSSGQHLNVQRNVDIGGGITINIPADPDVYPDDVDMPRDAIPHILEHAGVFIGWNCGAGDQACIDVVATMKRLVNDRIDTHDERIVMAHDRDLLEGTIGMAAWTRVENFGYGDYSDERVSRFTSKLSCRFDPEGFCR